MKKLTFFFLAMFGVSLAGCIFQGPCQEVLPYWKINAITTSNFEAEPDDNYPGHKLYYDTVSVDNYVCDVRFQIDFIAFKAKSDRLFFGNQLMAKSCDDNGMSGHRYSILNIHFITLQDFNDSYLENDTLPILILDNFDSYSPVSPEIYLDKFNETDDFLELFIKPNVSIDQEFLPGRYKVIVEVSNGEVFEAETGHVTLRQ